MTRRVLLLLSFLLVATLAPGVATAQEAPADPQFTVSGSGWGHAVGLTQYGARALAETGTTADQILTTYYSGVALRQLEEVLPADHWLRADPQPLWIGLGQNRTVAQFHVHGGPVGLCKANDNEGACPTQFANPDEAWEFRALGGGACQFFQNGVAVGNPGTCRGAIEWTDQPGTTVHFDDLNKETARGTIRFRPVGEGFHVVLEIGLEDYLYGIGEMPSDWSQEALKAQAIAARTYGIRQALKWGPEESLGASRQQQCWCQLYSTVVDQNYVGWWKEDDAVGQNWVSAVDATAGRVVTHPGAPDASVIIAYYSSSSGGHTDSNIDGLGQTTQLPYTIGIPDPWSVAPEAANPYASWTKQVAGSQIATAYGLDQVTGVSITQRNASTSVAEVDISGLLNGSPVTLTRSGRSFKSSLGLRSIFFDISGAQATPSTSPCAAAPAAGFTDVAADSVHRSDIDCMKHLGITAGANADGTQYAPKEPVPRWQMAIFLIRTATVMGLEVPAATDQGFQDLAGLSEAGVTAVNQLKALGVTSGVSPTEFDPDGTVTRWQMAIFLINLHSIAGFTPPIGVDAGFTDLTGLDPVWVTRVNQIAELGVTKGTGPGTFSPASSVTREQMATFLARLVEIDG